MKKNRLQQIVLLIACICIAQGLYAQEQSESLRDRLAKKQQEKNQNTDIPPLSVRAAQSNKDLTQDTENASWVREVYRYIDLEKGINAALYYPTQPIGKRMNLYTIIFKLLNNSDFKVYDFLDGREDFTEEYRLSFKEVLERLKMPYTEQGGSITYLDYDIPSNEVMGYYIKEAWYFDQSNSVLDVKVVAISPVLFVQYDDEIVTNRYPIFWVPYENIRPYTARMPIVTSEKNNVMNKTIDDFFRLRLYKGEIYKVTNMENKVLNQKYSTPEALKAAQEEIEKELKQFGENLWVINDSTAASIQKEDKRQASKAKRADTKESTSNATYSARDRR